jgi:hypothetical protein
LKDPVGAETSFGVWTSEDVITGPDGKPVNDPRIKVGQKRDWNKEPDVVKTTFDFVLAQCTKKLQKSGLQDLGITAAAADAGKIYVTGELPIRESCLVL